MSLILVIPDIHLKRAMFDYADKILESGKADFAVQMGDLVDDWGEQANILLYERTLKRAIKFKEDHPETLWVTGNHDFAYLHPDFGRRESGHSIIAEPFVRPLLEQLPQQALHIVDNVFFTHAGLTQEWVDRQKLLASANWGDFEPLDLMRLVNFAAPGELWQENSPIWVRPQLDEYKMYPAKLQVVGHTPRMGLEEIDGVFSTDTWSTHRDGTPNGDQSFAIVNTETGEWEVVYAD